VTLCAAELVVARSGAHSPLQLLEPEGEGVVTTATGKQERLGVGL
jgi:hypothetical protein